MLWRGAERSLDLPISPMLMTLVKTGFAQCDGGRARLPCQGKGVVESEGENVLHSFKKADEEGGRAEACFYQETR